MISIAVVGKTGQVATALGRLDGQNGVKIRLYGRPELDLTQPDTLTELFQTKTDVVVNAAAYTAVDKAEQEQELANTINSQSVGELARLCDQHRVPLVHISTDYVYNLPDERPADEASPVGPNTVYGQTKLDGELAVRKALKEHVILRTAWVFSPDGLNFVKTMLNLAEKNDTLTIVADQFGNPTAASDIADAIIRVVSKIKGEESDTLWGTYNFAGRGDTNWADFARATFEESLSLNGPSTRVEDIPSANYPTPAKRPMNSRLDTKRFEMMFGSVPSWKPALSKAVATILSQ